MLTVEDVQEAVKKSKFKITEIISLEAKNENSLAHAYAETNNLPIKEFLINWDDISSCESPKKNKYGQMYNPKAAFIRNDNMIKNSDALLIFFDPDQKGIESICSAAKKANLPIYYVKPNPEYIF